MDELDDAAVRALYRMFQERNKSVEHVGALFGDDDNLQESNIVTSGRTGEAQGTLRVPAGQLRALFHNHPYLPGRFSWTDSEAKDFTSTDRRQAGKLNVPSYISAAGEYYRYDPETHRSEQVLAQFPMDLIRDRLVKKILEDTPTVPRGLK